MPDDVAQELQWRGLVHQVTDEGLWARMASESFTLYHGMDATADSLHVGNLLGVVTLRRLQDHGHAPLVLLGGGTSMIGDPGGRRTERPLLSREQVEANTAGIRRQLESLLDFGPGAGGATLIDNFEWLSPLRVIDFLRDVGKHFTVNVMLAKEAVKARLEDPDHGISYTEFSYMLLQAYDYLHLFDTAGCRLQAGGSDQWGNITAGIDLIRRTRGEEAFGFTWPLVTKADGTKFGKSEAGNVWLDPRRTSPYQFFQFWLNCDDRDAGRYLRLYTFLDRERIAELEAAVEARPAEREAQRALAREVTALVHGEAAAASAERVSAALFGGDLRELTESELEDVFGDAPSSRLPRSRLEGEGVGLVELLAETGLVPSRSAARQAIAQGGVSLNGARQADLERRVGPSDLLAGRYLVLRRGKRNHHLVDVG
ncbi:MAG TPA: tyrosine--tRNA ligase [Acidimicrobiales bacterium]|nr:tyrosine--tRNA ligase [Acidimicrobiales bacterium]